MGTAGVGGRCDGQRGESVGVPGGRALGKATVGVTFLTLVHALAVRQGLKLRSPLVGRSLDFAHRSFFG